MGSVHDLIQAKVDRAQEHIDALKAMLGTYFDEHVQGARVDITPHTKNLAGIHYRNQVPLDHLGKQGVVIGDVIHNLRSGLDHLAWELVKANGGSPTKDTKFPILEVEPTPDRYGHTRPPSISGNVDPAALSIIESAQPYRHPVGPDFEPLLWLHNLWNQDKHRALLVTPLHIERLDIAAATDTYQQTVPGTMRLIMKGEDRAELGFVPDDPDMKVQLLLRMAVCLPTELTGGPGPLPVFEALNLMAGRVKTLALVALAVFIPTPDPDWYPDSLYRGQGRPKQQGDS